MFVALTPFVARPVLDLGLDALDSVEVGAAVGSFFGALLLFAVPVTLLGMVSPFAIRLALVDIKQAGAVAGRLYALSTVGSIIGTFLSAIVLIPLIGTQRTMLASAVLLGLAAALLLGRRWQILTVVLAALVLIPPGTIKASDGLIFETESTYQYIQVVERTDGSRALKLNEGVAVHSVWHEDTVLTGGVWDTFLMVPPLLDRPPKRMLIIGNAGGTIARAYGELYPDVEIDGVEIDPEVTEAGRKYLGLGDNPKLTTFAADGRPFLELTDARYDIVVVDAYHQPYIPFYLATKEFFELVRDRLEPGGIMALNVASVPGDARLPEAIGTTVLAAFPAGVELAGAAVQQPDPRLRRADRPGDAHGAGRDRAGRGRVARAARPVRARGGEAARRRAHRRPRARRVADRPDDRGLRLPRRRARRRPPSDAAEVIPRSADGGLLRIVHRTNTLAAVESALGAGLDGIELDVISHDGRLVLAHSPEEREPDAPPFGEALALAEGAVVFIDLKQAGIEEQVAEALRGRERTVVCSLDAGALRTVRRLEPKLATSLSYPADRLKVERARLAGPGARRGGGNAACGAALPDRAHARPRRGGGGDAPPPGPVAANGRALPRPGRRGDRLDGQRSGGARASRRARRGRGRYRRSRGVRSRYDCGVVRRFAPLLICVAALVVSAPALAQTPPPRHRRPA